MEQRRLPLYNFFQRLRKEAGIELDIRQYYAFLKSFTTAGEIDSPQLLLELCKIHWLSRPRHEREFEQLFLEEIRKELFFEKKMPEKEQPRDQKQDRPEIEAQPLQPQEPAEVKPSHIEKPAAPPPERILPEEQSSSIFINFKESRGQEVFSPRAGIETAAFLDNDFIFSDKYLPASDRRMKQNWRYLKARAAKAPGAELDIPSIVKNIAGAGFFTKPFFLPRRVYNQQVLFLIDRGGSMAAFETLSEHLVNTIQESLRAEHTTSLYFHNYPGDRLFLDSNFQRSIELPELLQQTPRHSTLAFVISDAGAARGGVHNKRIDETRKFIEKFKTRTPRLLWLNPIPRPRWEGSSAMYLSFFVDMLEASKEGFRKLPEKLKHL